MVSGDAHMLALDDGRNNQYGGVRGFPVLQAGALDAFGSEKGGPYSHGRHPGSGHFGVLEVKDTGGREIQLRWSGRNYENQEMLSLTVTAELP